MLLKERGSGMYRLSAYFFARMVGDLPLELALPTTFVTIVYWMGGLKPTPVGFFLTLAVVLYNVLVSQVMLANYKKFPLFTTFSIVKALFSDLLTFHLQQQVNWILKHYEFSRSNLKKILMNSLERRIQIRLSDLISNQKSVLLPFVSFLFQLRGSTD